MLTEQTETTKGHMMILRAFTLLAGLTGAGTLSQFPEFSQQYAQRLGGAVDALGQVVADFDASAATEGLTRDGALAAMTGSDFVDRRREDMKTAFTRHEDLVAAQEALQGAGPFMRAYHVVHLTDTKLVRQTAKDYKPAVPITFEGLTFGGVGFVTSWLLFSLVIAVLALPFRRRPRHSHR